MAMQFSARLFLLLLLPAAVFVADGEPIDRAELGRSVKLTILVDKVMQPTAAWVTHEWMVKEAAEAGFNVFSPRVGHDRLDEVRDVTSWCAKYGIFHMPWMRGTLTAPADAEADGQRVVWASGSEQALWSPNSDAFWAWTTKYIVEYAKMSAENRHIMGVFLDYENYAPGGSGNLYDLSYDDLILEAFAAAQDIELPDLAFDARKPWLEEQGLHEAFSAFQIAHWRTRCRALRKAVDEYDPTFQFCIYPAPGTLFMVEATYPEWGTDAAPIILADASTYGRPSRFLEQETSLEKNRKKLLDNMRIPAARGIPFIYSGGIDPVVGGADPEFSGKNAVMISSITGGYWIFYEGPVYAEDHPHYFQWFSWANKRIAVGDLDAWRQLRREPEDWSLGVFMGEEKGLALEPPPVTGERVEFPEVGLRGENLVVLAGRAGEPVRVGLENRVLGQYESNLMWEVRDLAGASLATGKIPNKGSGVVEFTPKSDGIYLLGASSGRCWYAVTGANVPVSLYARQRLGLINAVERMYFYVPQGLEQFTVGAKGAGSETVRVNVFDPTGTQVATDQTGAQREVIELTVPVGEHAGAIWSLQTTKADIGAIEDHSLVLDPALPGALALTPEQAFRK